MPKSKEYVSSSDDSSEEEVKKPKKQKRDREETAKEEKPVSSKKPKKEAEQDEDNVWDLGNNRQVSVREFKGRLYVDIREMYFDKEGNLKPGKKGICLGMAQWRKLLAAVEDVDRVVKSKC